MQWQTNLPLIAILRGITPEEALEHVGAVIDAGFDAVEIPLDSPEWEKSIPAVVDAFGDNALIGAGTVLQPEQVDRLAKMGCRSADACAPHRAMRSCIRVHVASWRPRCRQSPGGSFCPSCWVKNGRAHIVATAQQPIPASPTNSQSPPIDWATPW